MLSLARNGYTAQEVKDALHGKHGSRFLKFRYELLDKDDNLKGELATVKSGSVSLSFLNEIKRTAKFRIKDDPLINYLTDKIKPYCMVRMYDGGFIEFPLGVFLLSSPVKKEENGQVYRDVDAYDGIVVLLDDKFTDRYHIPAGTNYRTAVINILTSAGITKHNIEATTKTLANDLEFEIGTEKQKAVNELLRAINFRPIHVDTDGYYTSFTYVSPANRTVEYTYEANEVSVIHNGVESELDLFNVPNKWVVVRTNSEQAPLTSTYTNTNPDNPTSTVSRGRTIVEKREIDNIADQASLDAYTERIAFEASQVFGRVSFDTAIMPFHDYSDVYTFNYPALGENEKYHEVEWSFPLEAGGKMRHVARRTVQI